MTQSTVKYKYFYPIVLKNEQLEPFRISSNIEIRKLTVGEREEFFGLEKVDVSFKAVPGFGFLAINNYFPSQGKKGRFPYNQLMQWGMRDGSDDILASNYVLTIDSAGSPDFKIQRLNLAFKLFKPTSTGAYLGFREKETDVHIHYRMSVHGPFDYLSLAGADLIEVQRIFTLVEHEQHNDKFKLLADLYDRALQGREMPLDLRFLLLAL